MIIENKPSIGLNGETCIGSTPEEIDEIISATGVPFCLDIGHAICAANAHGVDPIEFLRDFLQRAPLMFHLTDGDWHSKRDSHLHFGEGNYPLDAILELLPRDARVTNEARRLDGSSLREVSADVEALAALVSRSSLSAGRIKA